MDASMRERLNAAIAALERAKELVLDAIETIEAEADKKAKGVNSDAR